MVTSNKFPVGLPLVEVMVSCNSKFGNLQASFDEVSLAFGDGSELITIQPLIDTDEIRVLDSPTTHESNDYIQPAWSLPFIGMKLQTVWICENSQGYNDLLVFAFRFLQPNIGFLAEGNVLKLIQFCMDRYD
ncbi:MAG: DUF6334 family protein [Chloroflexota bacterium]